VPASRFRSLVGLLGHFQCVLDVDGSSLYAFHDALAAAGTSPATHQLHQERPPDEDEELRRLYSYNARALPRREQRVAGAIMSAGDCAAELGALGRLIAEVASTTPALHAAAKSQLQGVLVALQNRTLCRRYPRRARAGSRRAWASRRHERCRVEPTALPAARNPLKKTNEKGGPRTKGVQEPSQEAARAKASKRSAADAGAADKRAKK
jgi:hypothetical protein